MNPPDNPFAFPVTMNGNQTVNQGITARDYFAAKAMQAIIATGFAREQKEQTVKDTAFSAYLMADTMLKEREKTL